MYRRTQICTDVHICGQLSLFQAWGSYYLSYFYELRGRSTGAKHKKSDFEWSRPQQKALTSIQRKQVIRLKNKSHSKRTRTHEMRNMGPAGICTSISPLYMIKSDRTFVFNMCTYARTHALLYSIYCCAHVVRLEACCDQRPNTARTTAVRYALYICVL